MKLDIPQDMPRQHSDSHPSMPTRHVPESALHRHLPASQPPATVRGHDRPPLGRRRREPVPDVPRERRRPMASVDPRRPPRSRGNVVGLELRPEEKQILHAAGRFRVVRKADLRDALYRGKGRPLENDLRYLRDQGLIETRHINLRRDGRRRTIERVEVVTLTREGRSLLMRDSDLPKDQKIYAGLVKPREVEHDSQIYRAYRKEAELVERSGNTNLRVRLDFEIKADVQKAIYRERKIDPNCDMADIKQQVAERFELPFVDGKIQIPDARMDYDLPRDPDRDQGSRSGHQDIEVLTAAYHAGHLRSKAQAGFRNYAAAADRASLTARIEDDSHLMENILDL
jgi:hypothetical protein